jgi:hypothetical protein
MVRGYYKVRKIALAEPEAKTDSLIMSLSQLVDPNQYAIVVLSQHCIATTSGGRSHGSVEPETR